MPEVTPPSKRAVVRGAERVLLQLLRTPKTRSGLVAAVQMKVSRNFVFGWLTEQCRSGRVVMLKSAATRMYQLSGGVVIEKPTEGLYPPWLEPRALPVAVSRRVFIDGAPVIPQEEEHETDL